MHTYSSSDKYRWLILFNNLYIFYLLAAMARDESSVRRPVCCCGGITQMASSSYCGPRRPFHRLCCQCCPPVRESKSTKCIYAFLLIVTTTLMGTAVMFPQIQRKLQAIFRDFNATCTDLKIGDNCMKLTGYMAAYKISFSVSFFFICLASVTFGLTTSKGTRACLHNGFWFFKMVTILCLITFTFFVPISHLDQLHKGWIYTCLLGNWIFMVLQLICLVDFSNALCRHLQHYSGTSHLWKIIEALSAFAAISIWLVMAISLFLIHGQQEFCLTKQLILIFNSGFCICLVLSALTPCARGPPNGESANTHFHLQQNSVYAGRLLQSGLVIVFMTFWIWMAMQSSPEIPGAVELTFLLEEDELACIVPENPFVEESLSAAAILMMFFTVLYINSDWLRARNSSSNSSLVGVSKTVTAVAGSRGLHSKSDTNGNDRRSSKKFHLIPSSASLSGGSSSTTMPMLMTSSVTCNCLMFNGTSFVNSNSSGSGSSSSSSKIPPCPLANGQHVPRPGEENLAAKSCSKVTYNYSLFHAILALATMFATTQLTKWFQPDDYKLPNLDRSWTTVLVKICSSWSCGFLYLVYLLIPDRCYPTSCVSSSRTLLLSSSSNESCSFSNNVSSVEQQAAAAAAAMSHM